jgi:membrane protein implicated in regulation of membrane protease activity
MAKPIIRVNIPRVRIRFPGAYIFLFIIAAVLIAFFLGYIAGKVNSADAEMTFLAIAMLVSLVLAASYWKEYSKLSPFKPQKGTVLVLEIGSLGRAHFTRYKVDPSGTVYDAEDKPVGRYDAARNAFILSDEPVPAHEVTFWSDNFKTPFMIYNRVSNTFFTRESLAKGEELITSISNTINAKISTIYRLIELAARETSRQIAKTAKKGLVSRKAMLWIVLILAIMLMLILGGGIILPYLQSLFTPQQATTTPSGGGGQIIVPR